jgi:hypothetical protein
MNIVFKEIKKAFADEISKKQIKTKHRNHGNLQGLVLLPDLQEKKKTIEVIFYLMETEKAMDVRVRYIDKVDKNNETINEYAFSDLLKGKELPMIDKDLQNLITDSLQYTVEEGKIISTISLETQIENFVKIIKSSWNLILNYQEEL